MVRDIDDYRRAVSLLRASARAGQIPWREPKRGVRSPPQSYRWWRRTRRADVFVMRSMRSTGRIVHVVGTALHARTRPVAAARRRAARGACGTAAFLSERSVGAIETDLCGRHTRLARTRPAHAGAPIVSVGWPVSARLAMYFGHRAARSIAGTMRIPTRVAGCDERPAIERACGTAGTFLPPLAARDGLPARDARPAPPVPPLRPSSMPPAHRPATFAKTPLPRSRRSLTLQPDVAVVGRRGMTRRRNGRGPLRPRALRRAGLCAATITWISASSSSIPGGRRYGALVPDGLTESRTPHPCARGRGGEPGARGGRPGGDLDHVAAATAVADHSGRQDRS